MYTIEGVFNIDAGEHVLAMFLNQGLFWMNNKASTSMDNTLLDLLNSSYPTQPHSLISN